MSNWDKRFITLANTISDYSKDRSTKCAAIIVGPDNEVRSIGYNGFPRGVDDNVEERHDRPAKYLYTEHGERNAIYNAARVGIPTNGCTMYVTSNPAKFPCCADCARAIIQAGITRVVMEPLDHNSEAAKRWAESSKVSEVLFKEAGVQLDEVSL